MIDSNINLQHEKSVDRGHKTKNSISDSSEITLYAGENPNKPYNRKTYYDIDSFPESSSLSQLPWTDFTRDFLSLDKKLDKHAEHICNQQLDKLVDLRPYMIENPETVTKFDFLPKVLDRFRHMHLRHLIVVNPTNNHLEGMITRQDIFNWMPM